MKIKLSLVIAIFQFSHLALALADEAPVPTKTPLDSEQQQLLNLGTKVVQNGVDGLKSEAISSINSEATGVTKSYLERFFPTVEVIIDLFESNKPASSLLILAPLSDPDDVKNTFFTQDSIYYQDNRTTINMGLGYRRLEMDNKLLLGVNAFYDHEFPYNHGRTSLGLEARSTVGEVNFNRYWAASGWKNGADGLEEHALGGTDLEAGVPLPYMNWAKLYVRGFIWNAYDGVADLKGNDISLRAQAPFMQGLSIEAGHRNFNNLPGEDFIRINYNLMSTIKPQASQPLISQNAYSLSSMENKRYDKVRRENLIVKQKRAKTFAVVVSGS
jgi:adhesin/invasin